MYWHYIQKKQKLKKPNDKHYTNPKLHKKQKNTQNKTILVNTKDKYTCTIKPKLSNILSFETIIDKQIQKWKNKQNITK